MPWRIGPSECPSPAAVLCLGFTSGAPSMSRGCVLLASWSQPGCSLDEPWMRLGCVLGHCDCHLDSLGPRIND